MSAITSHYNLAIIIQEQRRGNAVRNLKQDLTLVNQRLDKHGVATGKAASKTEQFVTKTKRLGQAIRKVLVPALLLAATAAAKLGVESVKMFAQFDKGMQEVFTLLPDRTKAMEDELTTGIQNVGKQFGYLTEETIPALYQALSAGVPEENAITAVELAAKAAKAGASDLESTMRIGMAVVNAYGGEIYSLEEAYDLIFQLIDKGVPRMSDWANSLQDVISIASEARTPFEDIVAALAVMTRQGDSAAESAELLGFILMQMQIEGTTAAKVFMDATGQSYRSWIASGKGLVEGLQMIDQYAIDTGQHLDSMIGGASNFYRDQQAARGTMELTGLHMQELIDLAELVGLEMEGSMEKAYGVASDNAQQSLDEIAAKWEVIKIKIGEAIWEQEIFLGLTGEQHVDNASLLLDYGFGELGNQLLGVLADRMKEVGSNKESLIEIAEAWNNEDRKLPAFASTFMPEFEAFNKTIPVGNDMIAKELAKYYGTLEEYSMRIRELGLVEDYKETGNAILQGRGTYDENRAFFGMYGEAKKHNAELSAQINEYYNAVHINQEEEMSNMGELSIMSGERRDIEYDRMRAEEAQAKYNEEDLFFLDSFYATQQSTLNLQERFTEGLITQAEYWEHLGVEGADFGRIIHWMAVDTQALGKASMGFMDTVFDQGKILTTAFEDLQEAGGDWVTLMKDNGGEISLIMGELAADLTDEEKSIMQGILRDSEEGGSDWLSSWRRLQSDLTETQRNELVARLADLQASQGNYEGVWTGDREKAETAAKAIIAAFEAIDQAYFTMGENMVTNKILNDIRLQDTVAGQQAMLAWQIALGNIDKDVGEAMGVELEKAALLEPILDEMYTAFMDDGKLAEKEARAMIKAIDVLHVSVGDLTDEGVKALLDKQLDEVGGYPRIVGLIRDDLGGAMDDQKKKQKELEEKPIVPVVELNKTTFDTLYDEMMVQIADAKGPWPVVFNGEYNGVNPNEGQATGTGGTYRQVPSGYPNDSYLVGLTSGEQFAVLTPGQQRQQGGGGRQYNNHSITNFNIVNNSRAAAAYSRAYIETVQDKRIRRFAGE